MIGDSLDTAEPVRSDGAPGSAPGLDSKRSTMAERIKAAGLVAIIRGSHTAEQLLDVGAALAAGGVSVLEVTLTSPHALEGIELLRRELGDRLSVGAGTVLDAAAVDACVAAGAEFIIAPDLNEDTVAAAARNGVLIIPGVFTGTEVGRAVRLGCTLLKLFPASSVGPGYIKALAGPFPRVEFIPTGGVGAGDLASYTRAGAVAFGIGSALVHSRPQDLAGLTEAAAGLVAELSAARAEAVKAAKA
ncbi:MAG TPA: bifunctional 4-hydroxy-2-oxoglutarate aldolase/2-dehydro-3-deoxy-phosphogluconate aldolase [Trueperaceae bacterium]|nr:bifunctional 4-hydroxy-2-oxoglutarate aldolase/2-dehydro-3-deoxy-phosphogluconate aldolase [Trueperaceae bacterium]